jgi:arsenate reductase
MTFMKKRVLFLCTANTCRSQMAEGISNHFRDKIAAFSAGTEASYVHPTAIEVMKEIGIDISRHQSKNLTAFDGQSFDYVITLCGSANEACPLYIGATKKSISVSTTRRKPGGQKKRSSKSFAACAMRLKKN